MPHASIISTNEKTIKTKEKEKPLQFSKYCKTKAKTQECNTDEEKEKKKKKKGGKTVGDEL